MVISNVCDKYLKQVLALTRELLSLADEGDAARQDVGCGVLFGTMRDSAYKMKTLAEAELAEHARQKLNTHAGREGLA